MSIPSAAKARTTKSLLDFQKERNVKNQTDLIPIESAISNEDTRSFFTDNR